MCNVSERREIEFVVEMAIDVLDHRVQSPLVFRLTAAWRGQRLSAAVDDAALGEIVGRHLDGHLVAGENANVILAHLPRDVRSHNVPGFEFHPERCVRQSLDDFAFHLNRIFFRHQQPVAGPEGREFCQKSLLREQFSGDCEQGHIRRRGQLRNQHAEFAAIHGLTAQRAQMRRG